MPVALDLPAASGPIIGAEAGTVLLAGYSVRAAAAAVTANIREGSATGHIVAYLGFAIAGATTNVFHRPINCHGPLYCEYTAGAAAGLGAVYIE